jgi:hypothetical protein
MPKTPRKTSSRRRKTYRQQAGDIASVEALIRSTPIGNVHIINPASRFVVVTYWWGRENMNRNLQNPCPEDIMDIAKNRIIAEIGRETGFPRPIVDEQIRLEQITDRPLTRVEKKYHQDLKNQFKEWATKKLAAIPDLRDRINAIVREIEPGILARPGSVKPRKFPEMIAEWEDYCKKAGVNYVAVNTEFPRADYQNAINGKPLFIKQALDAVKPRNVLYIDGDMWILKYPHLFDLENVDFMARGWNVDPRTKERAMQRPYFDPYTLETSGGTMYFGNTIAARELLDAWEEESNKQIGKADDRILSQVFTKDSMVLKTNTIQLPIEYLWLTDNYKSYLRGPEDPSSHDDAFIEHFYCLTGEERAAEQGAAASGRTPEGYEEEVTDNINYKRPTELIYEYIFFDGDKNKCDGFARYFKYLESANNYETSKPPKPTQPPQLPQPPQPPQKLAKIVKLEEMYGPYNDIAKKNLEGLGPQQPIVPGVTVRPGAITNRFSPHERPQRPAASLPQTASIRDILQKLMGGEDVELGGRVQRGPEDDCVAVNVSTTGVDFYTRTLELDTNSPMFFSSKSRTLIHLLAMCETLKDINKHLAGSYMFMSRIRWNLKNPKNVSASSIEQGIDFRPVFNQIWFGAEIPQWRKLMFDVNKKVCEESGYEYKLWKNQDRNAENFPQTIAYQNAALEAGQATGQSRWAQVADLARLEIVYNLGGIYADSLVEITPALLKAVTEAINQGAQFVGCNEDECEPPLDCKNAQGEMYLSNSFFAATRGNPIFERLLSSESLDNIDMEDERLNHTTGPYFLRAAITPQDSVFMFKSNQIYQFNQQETPYKEPNPDPFLFKNMVAGAVKVNDNMYYLPGGIKKLQTNFLFSKKGPLATYHSGLGGTWST